MGGISASVSTVPDSLNRYGPAYSSPSTLVTENFITVAIRASIKKSAELPAIYRSIEALGASIPVNGFDHGDSLTNGRQR